MNNTIVFNSAAHGGGICCNNNSDPIFINNITWGNTSPDGNQVNLLDTQSDPHFLYCDIQGGREGFGGNGAGTNYTGIYENNIDLDPLLRDTTSGDYRLSDLSHCIGAGFDSVEVLGIWYHAPATCIVGNPRPSPVDSRPDIGACESPLSAPGSTGVEETHIPARFLLLQNYPNPFNPTTAVSYQLSAVSDVKLVIFDMLGREVAVLVKEKQNPGRYEVQFDASRLASGVYFYRLEAGQFVSTRKLVVLR
jgi:hypothetical protein